jgi:hypothetical protein
VGRVGPNATHTSTSHGARRTRPSDGGQIVLAMVAAVRAEREALDGKTRRRYHTPPEHEFRLAGVDTGSLKRLSPRRLLVAPDAQSSKHSHPSRGTSSPRAGFLRPRTRPRRRSHCCHCFDSLGDSWPAIAKATKESRRSGRPESWRDPFARPDAAACRLTERPLRQSVRCRSFAGVRCDAPPGTCRPAEAGPSRLRRPQSCLRQSRDCCHRGVPT